MELSQTDLILIFVYSIAVGAILGIFYDIFRIQRLFMSSNGIAVQLLIFAEDIIFALASAIIIVVLIFQVNSGQVRWFAFAGAGSGFMLYYFTIGKIVMLCSARIISFIRMCVNLVKLPVLKCVSKIRMKLYTKKYKAAMLEAASRGFDWQGSETKWSKLNLRKKLKSRSRRA